MNPGDQVILHKAVKPVTVAEVEGDRFCHFITPGGSPQWHPKTDALVTMAGPVEVAQLRDRQEADGD